jgi:ABC-type histidine transport system ATPase subunit
MASRPDRGETGRVTVDDSRAALTAAVEVRDLTKRFGTVQALAGVSLQVEQGEFFALLGPTAPERPRSSRCWAA